MKINRKQLAICIAIPLLVGALAALITRGDIAAFEMMRKPPLSPPAWLFPVVWTILYALMGISSYLILNSGASEEAIRTALGIYALQLIVNFFWSIIFFGLGLYLFAFIWLLVLWALILLMIIRFYPLSNTAAYLNIPYILWVTFAGYLNFAIYLLN